MLRRTAAFYILSKSDEFSAIKLLCQTGADCSRTGLMKAVYMVPKSLVSFVKLAVFLKSCILFQAFLVR